jgi:hypothetical protein
VEHGENTTIDSPSLEGSTLNALVCASAGDDSDQVDKLVAASKRIGKLARETSDCIDIVHSASLAFAKYMFDLATEIKDLFCLGYEQSLAEQAAVFAPRLAAELVFHSYLHEELYLVFFPPSRNPKERSRYVMFYRTLLNLAYRIPTSQDLQISNGAKDVDKFVQNFTNQFSESQEYVIARFIFKLTF